MQIEYRPIDAVKPYPENPRVNDAAIPAVARSIREFGFRNPILVDADGVVIAGHTRLAAARSLGLAEVPVVVCADLSPDQTRALRIADNQVGTLAEWDEGLLRSEIARLSAEGLDLDVLGFGEELAHYLPGDEEEGSEEEAPLRYLLALMLERKRILKHQETRQEEGRNVLLYLHAKTGEAFLIPDPELHLDELEPVQAQLVQRLDEGRV